MEQFKPGIYIARDSKRVKYGGEYEGSWLSKYSFVEPEDFEKVASKLKSGKNGDRPIYTKLKTYHKDIWNSIQKNLGIKEEDFFANDLRLEIQEEVVIEQDDKKIILEKGDRIEVLKEDETITWKEFIDKELIKHNSFSEFALEIPYQQVRIHGGSHTSCKLEGKSLKILFKNQIDEFIITPNPNDIVTIYEDFNYGFKVHLRQFDGIFYAYY